MTIRCQGNALASNVESKMHDVAVRDHVFLAFEAPFARIFRALFAVVGDEVIVADDLGTNESLFEVGVNDPGGLRRLGADRDRPRTRLLGAGSEVGMQLEQ